MPSDRPGLCAAARAYIASSDDPRELVALSESLRLDRVGVVLADADGVAARVTASGDYLVGARDQEAAARLLAALGDERAGVFQLALQDEAWASIPGAVSPTGASLSYRICIYEGREPVPLSHTLRVEPLTPAHLPVVLEHYTVLPEDFVARHLADGWLYGGYNEAGELVGFVGEHDEGAIGMLEVFAEHRRRGYAFELEGFLVNRMLDAGRTPYCQVVAGNEASFALQRKLGFTVLPRTQCWCW